MSRKLKKVKKSRMKKLSPNYTLRAPPCDKYSTFQPGGFSKLYHHCEEARMKRSYHWVYSAFEAESAYKKVEPKKIQEDLLRIKSYIKEGMLRVEIGEYNKEQIEEVPIITPTIEEGMLKVEFGEKNNKKVIYIDFKGYWSTIK